MKVEVNKTISFLNVLALFKNLFITPNVYRKPTHAEHRSKHAEKRSHQNVMFPSNKYYTCDSLFKQRLAILWPL